MGVKFFWIKHHKKDTPRCEQLHGDISSKVCLPFLSLPLQSCLTVSIPLTHLFVPYSSLPSAPSLVSAAGTNCSSRVESYFGYRKLTLPCFRASLWIRVHLSIVTLTSFPWFYIDLASLLCGFPWIFFCFLGLILIEKVSSLLYLVTVITLVTSYSISCYQF